MNRPLFVFFILFLSIALQAQEEDPFVEKSGKLIEAFRKAEKPWIFSAGIGLPYLEGEVISRAGFNIHLSAKRQLTRLLTVGLNLNNGISTGRNWYMNSGFFNNPAWNGTFNPNANYIEANNGVIVVFNYKAVISTTNLELSTDLIQILYQKYANQGNFKWRLPIGLGFGTMLFNTKINAMNTNENIYDFTSIGNGEAITNADILFKEQAKTDIKALFDKSYETSATSEKAQFLGASLTPIFTFNYGFVYKANETTGIGLQFVFIKTFSDLVDGHQWTEQNELSKYDDWVYYLNLNLQYSLGKIKLKRK